MKVRDIYSTTVLFFSAVIFVIAVCGTASAQANGLPVRFAVLGDRTGGHVPGMWEESVAEVERLQPDFIMTVGDMIEGYADDSVRISDEWKEFYGLMQPLTMPVHYTPGNHDIWSDYAETQYRREVGNPYYSFDHDNLHFIVLDMGRWDESRNIPEKQLNWLIQDLQKASGAAYTFVFVHKPFWYESVAQGKPDTLHSLFVKYGVDAVFTGHYHEYFAGNYDGIIYTGLGSSGAEPSPSPTGLEYHFAWVTINDKGIHIALIRKDGVLPWDYVLASDRVVFQSMRRRGMAFENPALVGSDLSVPESRIGVSVKNISSDFAVNDTLRWTVPEGWKVVPSSMAIQVPPDKEESFSFLVSCDKNLYPVPGVGANFTYAEGKNVPVTSDLRVARQAFCYPADSKPKIDGKISEACWQDPVTRFFDSDGKDMTTEPVKFYFAYDGDNLYLAARCTESNMDSLMVSATAHDGFVFADDCVGYFIEPVLNSDTIYQIYFNASGVAFDQKIWRGEDTYADADRAWDGKYEVKTSKGKDFWAMEAKIPLDQFGTEFRKDQKCRLNFRRKQPRLSGIADWQIPIDYYADTYGFLIMK
jgi:3',5'-cyclic AMP phosphodiesterase CpdA